MNDPENIAVAGPSPKIIKIKRKIKTIPAPAPAPVPVLSPNKFPEKTLEELYIASLSEKEMVAYEIAKTHLKSTFSLEKSNGFIEWKKNMSDNIANK